MSNELTKVKTLALIAGFTGAIIPFVGIALGVISIIWVSSIQETETNKVERRSAKVWIAIAFVVSMVAFRIWYTVNNH